MLRDTDISVDAQIDNAFIANAEPRMDFIPNTLLDQIHQISQAIKLRYKNQVDAGWSLHGINSVDAFYNNTID